MKTGQVKGEPRPLSWALLWAPSVRDLWELSWGVLEGLKTGIFDPRGRSRGSFRGRTRGPTGGSSFVKSACF